MGEKRLDSTDKKPIYLFQHILCQEKIINLEKELAAQKQITRKTLLKCLDRDAKNVELVGMCYRMNDTLKDVKQVMAMTLTKDSFLIEKIDLRLEEWRGFGEGKK